jgi:hypothetical protein
MRRYNDEMCARKPTNPFYLAAIPVGILFAVTACAYVVMMVRAVTPQPGDATPMVQWLDRNGLATLIVELSALGLLTFAAIASDDFWTRRFEEKQARTTGADHSS